MTLRRWGDPECKTGDSGSSSVWATCALSELGKPFHFSEPFGFSCFVKGDRNIYLRVLAN